MAYVAKGRKLLSRQLAFHRLGSISALIGGRIALRYHEHGPMAEAVNAFYCEVDAEPLNRYHRGGYHPTHLGDTLKDGRYQIIHKLGWGGYATVWLAKDRLLCRHTAIKILVSELSQDDHEAQILNLLSQGPANHAGKKHVVQLLDQFHHEGPNGIHPCLVLELLGPSVPSKAESYASNRLPGHISRDVSMQIAQGLDYIHSRGIAHGDLHLGNVVFAHTISRHQLDADLMKSLNRPQIGDVQATYGFSLSPHVPEYLVLPTLLPSPAHDLKNTFVKIVDFGEAFEHGQDRKIRCPLVFRAPETNFTSEQDSQADIWSFGCTIFELIVGYPPFDTFMSKRDDLIREWVSMFGDLPSEWREYLPSLKPEDDFEVEKFTLAEWLHKTYFDGEKKAYFNKAEIDILGDLLQSMMQYRPSDRPQASELIKHSWFQGHRAQLNSVETSRP